MLVFLDYGESAGGPAAPLTAGLINAGKALGRCAIAAGDFAGMGFVFANVS